MNLVATTSFMPIHQQQYIFGPNFVGKITEIRVWALVRPQDQIYANREWPLKMAKKKRKNRLQGIKISASGKPKTKAPGVLKPMVKYGLSASKSRGRRVRKRQFPQKEIKRLN